LSINTLDHASKFSSDQCPEGIVSVSHNILRILSVEKIGTSFNQTAVPLRYTPRKMVLHAPSRTFAIIEADHRTTPLAQRVAALTDLAAQAEKDDDDMETDDAPAASSAEATKAP